MAQDPINLPAAASGTQASKPPLGASTPDQLLEPLRNYDVGSSRAVLMPLDDALQVALKDPRTQGEWESRFTTLLEQKLSPVAKRYLCAKLALLGSARAVPALASLLSEPDLSHPAQDALFAIPGPESLKALRDSLPRLRGLPRIGVINSLGARRDEPSVPLLSALLTEPDSVVVAAAAAALGNIGTMLAASVLRQFLSTAPPAARAAAADACLACAERFLDANQKTPALALYKPLTDPGQPKQVQLAARRGLLQAARRP